MSNEKENDKSKKIKQIVKILEFVLTVNDKDLMRSSIETIIEMLKEIS